MKGNLTLLTDLYELTMMYGYVKAGTDNRTAVFDIFFRNSEKNTYAVTCGLEQAVEYILNIDFSDEDIAYLRSLKLFDDDFLKRLKNFKFSGDVYAIPEGTVVYPYEPLLTVKATLFEAQFVETALLNIINHQSLIATKASKIVYAAQGKPVMEFGLRRAHGPDAGVYGARAAMVAGCVGTSNVLAGQMFDVPVLGTHAHSFVMSFKDELTAFRHYAEIYPDNCLLLVDTYDTLRSGVPNAIKVFDELKAKGHKPVGIRLDSGDLAYLSKKAREMLDAAGHTDAKIFASNDIDENVLTSLHEQGAKIDVFGIGTKLITSYDNPSFGGVYKLAAIENGDGVLESRMKVSDTAQKMTNPGFKGVFRIYEDGHAAADLIALYDEKYDESKPLTVFNPVETWKKTTFENYKIKKLTIPVIEKGKLRYKFPTLKELAEYSKASIEEFWEEYKRYYNPHIYKVDLSDKVYALKKELLEKGIGR